MTTIPQTAPALIIFDPERDKESMMIRYLWERRRALITELRAVEKLLEQPSSLKDKKDR